MTVHYTSIRNHPMQQPQAVALSMQEAQWKRLAVVTNNIANANTPGFKGLMLKLEEYSQKNHAKRARSISYVKANRQIRNLSDGSFRKTGNPLDICLTGNGFFMVQAGQGRFLTRNGQFTLDVNKRLVTAQGKHIVLNKDGAEIVVDSDVKNLSINELGEVYGDGNFLGQIAVVTVRDPQYGIKNKGDSLFEVLEKGEPQPAINYAIQQGGVEESNVSIMSESIFMMRVLREYEHAQKLIDDYDQNKRKALGVSARNV